MEKDQNINIENQDTEVNEPTSEEQSKEIEQNAAEKNEEIRGTKEKNVQLRVRGKMKNKE